MLNMFDRVQLALSATGADIASRFPVPLALEVGIPERPGLALTRARRINGALAILKKDAVSVFVFDKALAGADAANIVGFEFFDFLTYEFREGCDLFLVDPNIARCPRAAVAALRAFKFQTVFVPGFARHNSIRSCFGVSNVGSRGVREVSRSA